MEQGGAVVLQVPQSPSPPLHRITDTVEQVQDYRLTYHHARDASTNTTTTTVGPTTTTTAPQCGDFHQDESCDLDETNIVGEYHNLLVGDCQDSCAIQIECHYFTW